MLLYKTIQEAELVLQRELTNMEKLWISYSATKSNYFLYAHNVIFVIIFYTLVPLPLALFELNYSKKNKYKIQRKVKVSYEEIIRCYKETVRIFVLAVGSLSLLSYPVIEWVGIRTDLSLDTFWEVVSQLFVYFLVEDYVHYWVHRLLHCKWGYENIHRVHHEFTAPIGLAAPYAHWVEVLLLGLPSFAGPAMVPCHMLTFWLWMVLRQAEAIETHSGYNFPWSPTKYIPFYGGAEYHDYHHFIGGQSQSNFASVFTYCDYIYGTDKGYRYQKTKLHKEEEEEVVEQTMGWEPTMMTTPIANALQEEKILVTVRLRPLNDKEIAKNDVSDWECINDNTVIYRNSLAERYNYPTAYTFDRVFQGYCTTKQVYDEAAKGVALSVVSGINSSIFAYGQTSSGKTYTMVGITEYTVADIFDYIQRHEERAFVMKFSAMEIYNEAVRDLLSGDNSPLRVLDDPEKGTIVEKLTEETLRDKNHLRQLLSICEAQRQVGETLLNEASSRSHQILKLTIESSAREFLGKDNSSTLAATVNFVDLAGSERASQALSAGTRLKEGCHINRSLLTLGTVIRKLSKGRNGHVPYRDSKLTRILQPSLGGNARTAIICTLSPARSHVEQTRNTLLFASCAKEVATNAHVNVVMSDKALVKHLQKELARLESELRSPVPTPATSSSAALLREKDRQIEKMQKEIKELTWQRNLAQSRLEDLLKVVGDDKSSRNGPQSHTWEDDNSVSELSGTDFHQGWKERTGHTVEDLEDLCKEVRCIEMEESSTNKDVEFHASLSAESDGTMTANGDATDRESIASPQRGDARPFNSDSTYGALEQKLQDVQKTIDGLVNPYPEESYSSPVTSDLSRSRTLQLSRSRSCRETLMKSSPPWSQEVDQNVNTPPNGFEKDFPGRPNGLRKKLFALKYDADNERLPVDDSHSEQSAAVGEDAKTSFEEDVTSIGTFVTGLKEMAKLQYEKQFVGQGQETGLEVSEPEKCSRDVGLDPMLDTPESPLSWTMKFQRQRTEIIELWHICNVSLVHRTYFFLLFNGEPTDNIYMEVELRRLSFLKDAFIQGLPDTAAVEDGHAVTPASSIKALRRERVMLSRRMQRRLSVKERENLYQKWGIGLDTKQRRLQLVQCLWTNTEDMDHIMDSAAVVAKLVGLLKPGQVLKEMFGLSFTPTSQRSFSWKHSLSSLM
ncbi:hypothetical protein AQUCO_00600133v1 [Aquilegia coerulea]|uniref:Kinesin motor domain-containing protein n=1 Tax=Aquilegia coerulea TaxID=218851 RepID=A0A2G5EN34_AQUCA|nr:hypothetical protein AQUCO_00600133v1 [Aquilegia coerulea]